MTLINNSTSAFFERSTQGLAALRKRAEGLQGQLGSGERLSRSSDDPVAASRLRQLSRADRLSDIDVGNANRAMADLQLADSAMTSIASFVTRAKELALQAANDTLTDSQRASIGTELDQIHEQLVSLANSRDSAGHALFGGQVAGDAYSLDGAGNAVYLGTATSGEIPIGDGQGVTRSLTGPEVFDYDLNATPENLLAVIKTLGAALQGVAADPAGAARDALGSLTAGLDNVTTGQTVIGTRLAWIDLTLERHVELSETRATEEAEVGGADIAGSIAQLQEVMLVLEASQASFAKLANLSLFSLVR
jgi:flagellar hook-associated protein 3 FlgL